ncbi:MAG: glutamine-synthetase adenylyltransferase, partial [Sphingomonas sp.]
MTSAPFDPSIVAAAQRARREAPFLALLLDREPGMAETFLSGHLPPLKTIHADLDDEPVARRLRLARRRLALRVAIGDLAGVDDLTSVTQTLSDFADRALDAAIVAAIAERTPDAAPVGFAAIALGKQGSRELN